MQAPDHEKLVVLESFVPPHPMTNPYLTQLFESFPDDVQPVYFSWRRALVGHYDAFHLHWPEVMVRGTDRIRTIGLTCMFLAVLLRLRLQRKPLVRTMHNRRPHERPNRLHRLVLDLTDRWTTLWILFGDTDEPPTDAPSMVIAQGHYVDWFADQPRADVVPGRLLQFGLIRRYKGVERLLDAFSSLSDPGLSLRVVGRTVDDDVGAAIRAASAADPRISACDDYVGDDVLVGEITSAELVVAPFVAVTNSSSVIVALSLGRAVLVPSTPTTEAIAAEIGRDWVITHRGQLTGADIEAALATVRSHGFDRHPDLGGRAWASIGEAHAQAIRRARDIIRNPPEAEQVGQPVNDHDATSTGT